MNHPPAPPEHDATPSPPAKTDAPRNVERRLWALVLALTDDAHAARDALASALAGVRDPNAVGESQLAREAALACRARAKGDAGPEPRAALPPGHELAEAWSRFRALPATPRAAWAIAAITGFSGAPAARVLGVGVVRFEEAFAQADEAMGAGSPETGRRLRGALAHASPDEFAAALADAERLRRARDKRTSMLVAGVIALGMLAMGLVVYDLMNWDEREAAMQEQQTRFSNVAEDEAAETDETGTTSGAPPQPARPETSDREPAQSPAASTAADER